MSVGGDGTFSECINGIILNNLKKKNQISSISDAEMPLDPITTRVGPIAGGYTELLI